MKARKSEQSFNSFFYEKYVDDQLYAFSRGTLFVALTNVLDGQVHREVRNSGFSEGEAVCNIFYPTDCVKVTNGVLPIYLDNGEVKIFVPKSSSFWGNAVKEFLQ